MLQIITISQINLLGELLRFIVLFGFMFWWRFAKLQKLTLISKQVYLSFR